MTDNSHGASPSRWTAGDDRYRWRSTRRSIIGALLGAAWSLLTPPTLASAHGAAAAPAPGRKLALVDLPLIEGGTFRAAEANGRVVVVYWWASWCPFCAEMSPSIEKLWRSQRDRGLTVIGISIDKSVEPAREYRRRRNYTFPSAMYTPDIEGVLPKPKRVPVLWVRDRAERVVMAETGQMFPEDVEQIARFL
jgi:thiol-disulfide isomerase/thioredoxin